MFEVQNERGKVFSNRQLLHLVMAYRVVPSGSNWKILKENALRASAVRQTKQMALQKAKDLAEKNDEELIVHRKDGTVQR